MSCRLSPFMQGSLLRSLRVAYMDVGMPNSSGTKFGRNGHNCYDRFAFETHRWGLKIVGCQCVAMAPIVNIAARCLHGFCLVCLSRTKFACMDAGMPKIIVTIAARSQPTGGV